MAESAIRVVRAADLSDHTAQTPGMLRRTAIDGDSVGARSLWMGRVFTDPGMRSGAHHHGESESGIFVISGHLRMLFGEGLRETVDARAGDYIYVPANCVHVEMNVSDSEPADVIVVRDRGNIVVPAGTGS